MHPVLLVQATLVAEVHDRDVVVVAVEHDTTDYVGLGLGANYFGMGLDAERNFLSLDASYEYFGLLAYLRAYF